MAVKVVGAEIKPDRDIGTKPVDQIQLIGRQLQNKHRIIRRSVKVERGDTDIATGFSADTGNVQNMAGQCRCCRFSVGAGNGDEPCRTGHLAIKQFNVADDLDARLAGKIDNRMRKRMGQRHAWRQNKRGHFRPRPAGRIRNGSAKFGGLVA